MRLFYLSYPPNKIRQTPSGILEAASAEVGFDDLLAAFPLPWSAYVRLLSVRSGSAREFYETEALRGGWSVRQLDRQIGSQFYERTALSKNRAAMLTRGQQERPEDLALPGEQIKDPLVLEFLDLKDEYSENDLEEALIRHLETFLLELGDDFCFMGRQRRLRVGSQWYRVDLLFFHRRLRCLVVIDLKIGSFTHADAGQMHFYLNYAREHWVREGENPPVGLILCSEKDEALAQYALEGLSNKVMAAEYRIALPQRDGPGGGARPDEAGDGAARRRTLTPPVQRGKMAGRKKLARRCCKHPGPWRHLLKPGDANRLYYSQTRSRQEAGLLHFKGYERRQSWREEPI